MPTTLTPEQETQAQQIVTKLKEQANDHFLAIARTLVATDERTLFGQTEFDIRDQVLKLVGTAYSLHLSQKKKRLPRLLHRLPRVRPGRSIPRLPHAETAKPRRPDSVLAGVLLLPPMRNRDRALG